MLARILEMKCVRVLVIVHILINSVTGIDFYKIAFMSVTVTDRVVVDSHQRPLFVAIVINDKSLLWIHTIELDPNRTVFISVRVQKLISPAIDREIRFNRDVVVLFVILF